MRAQLVRPARLHSWPTGLYDTTTIGEHADDAAALLEVLSASPAVVIGRNCGGEIAVDLLPRYPDLVRGRSRCEQSTWV